VVPKQVTIYIGMYSAIYLGCRYDSIIMNLEDTNRNSCQPFQKCGSCEKQWNRWLEFILDPDVRLIGFQAISDLPDANLLVFEHRCGSSISVFAKRLRHNLSDTEQAIDLPRLFGKEGCNSYCQSLENLEACDRPCANARDRRLILKVLRLKRGQQ
jgi:hypothetical protein